tara:strand:- start:3165 stop:5012 length:1848 start_codon:yes stop_codon:yes gene_type:complete
MPLIDLKTNLKSLKYGMDRPGGGSSGLPYIQTRMAPANLITLPGPGNTNPIFKPGTTGNADFPIRGGNIDFNIGTQTFTISSKVDKERIKKFMKDPSRGKIFLDKQIGLQLSNPKIETGKSFQVAPASNILPGLLNNTRIYNRGFNTLEQVGFAGTGFHVPRAGISPFDYASKYYKDIVGAQSLLNAESVVDVNRLLILRNLKLASRPSNSIVNINQVNNLGISLNRQLLFNYLGGPESVYGVGATTIKRVVDTSRAVDKYIKIMDSVAMTYDNIINQKLNTFDKITGKKSKNIQDYRTGNQIDTREDVYNLTVYGKSDKMNTMSSFMFDNSQDPWDVADPMATGTKDIIKFVFEAIENNSTSQSWAIFFRAMLSGFSDNHQASINAFKYIGRGEDFYTYQGVSRAISFSFKIGVQSRNELKPLYTKLNHLISQVYPDYSSKFKIMRAPIVRLTIGDYLHRVAGMLENVSITVDDNVPWEINYENSKDVKQLPQVINVQCSFKPIQDFLPRRENNEVYNVPFIGKQNGSDYVSISDGFRFDQTTRNILNSTAIDAQSSTISESEANMFPSQDLSGVIPPTTSPLKYSPPKKAKLFESNLERDVRIGNFFNAFRQD